MNIILTTKRLILREFQHADATYMYRLNNNPEVLRYTGDIPFSSITEAEQFLKNYKDYEKNGFGRWAVELKNSGEFIGWCGLKRNEDGIVDIGFRLFQEQWGKSYATEAAQACLGYGIDVLKLERIIGRAAIDNKASVRVLEKIGMCPCKTEIYDNLGMTQFFVYP